MYDKDMIKTCKSYEFPFVYLSSGCTFTTGHYNMGNENIIICQFLSKIFPVLKTLMDIVTQFWVNFIKYPKW